MFRSYKLRIYPNNKQRTMLSKTFGCVRWIYNQFLAERKTYYEKNNSLKGFRQSTEKQLKEKFEWLKECDAIALVQSRRHLDKAYANFFRKLKLKQPTSIRFKKKSDHNSYTTYSRYWKIDFQNKRIRLPKIGFIKFKDARTFNTMKIHNVTVSRNKSGQYFASVLIEEDTQKFPESNQWIGIDLGVNSFISCSDGTKIENPRILKQYEKKLSREQRRFSRKVKGSKNRDKQRLVLTKIHQKIANIRTDFQQKLSTKLIRENQTICLESLKVGNMLKNHKLAKSVSDCSWSSFVSMLKYKANWYGRTIIQIGTFFPSSKLCSDCGFKLEKLDLRTRSWKCPNCGSEHDRDLNAAKNILQEGIKLSATAGTAESKACGEMKQPAFLPKILNEAGTCHKNILVSA